MYRVRLVNMPFSTLRSPSLGLTQLKAVLDQRFGDQVSTEVLYLNHDFGHFFGVDTYQEIVLSPPHMYSGLGDWIFRQVAFPNTDDNAEEYFRTCYPYMTARLSAFKQRILERRAGLADVLDEIVKKYALTEADLVGFTSMFTQNTASFALARKLKEARPGVITVMGGANCDAPMGQEIANNVPQLDFVFSGPALSSFPAFIQHQLDGDARGATRTRGVLSNATISLTGEPTDACDPAIPGSYGDELDIDTVIGLDYEPFLNAFEQHFPDSKLEPVLYFETSRGCWWGERAHCTFCGLNGLSMAYRSMSAENAIRQFERLFSYASRCKSFNCVDNILPKNYIKDVFPHIHAPEDVEIFYEVKADLSEDDVHSLSNARVKAIQPGIESLATSSLKLVKKGTSVFQNLRLLQYCVMHDVHPDWNLLIGIPGEQEEVYEKYLRDIPLLMHLPPPNGAFPIRFDRYSPYFDRADEYDLLLRPFPFYGLIYPFTDASLQNLAYSFVDWNMGPHVRNSFKWMGRLQKPIAAWRARWHGEPPPRQPRLVVHRTADGGSVYDSRSGDAVEYAISALGLDVLRQLRRHTRHADLQSSMAHVPARVLEEELGRLDAHGLLFHEGDHLMSLVLWEDPPEMSHRG